MIVGERHHICLIKGNTELQELQRKSTEDILLWQLNIVKGVSDLTIEDAIFSTDNLSIFFKGFKKMPTSPGWKWKRDRLSVVPAHQSKDGKAIKALIAEIGPYRFKLPEWLTANNLTYACAVCTDSGIVFVKTEISMNADGSEFLILYPLNSFKNWERI
jgi:hypothetical protein